MIEEIRSDTGMCAFCEATSVTSPTFLRINHDGRVGGTPMVLGVRRHPECNFICLQHWLENKRLYAERFGRDSFEGNPTGPDAVIKVARQLVQASPRQINLLPPGIHVPLESPKPEKASSPQPAAAAPVIPASSPKTPAKAPSPAESPDLEIITPPPPTAASSSVAVPTEAPSVSPPTAAAAPAAKQQPRDEEKVAALQTEGFKLAAAALPPGMFVGVPSVLNAMGQAELELDRLSPLFVQFLAWQRLMQINQQLQLMQTHLTSEQQQRVLDLQLKASFNATQARHRNPITPNYSLQRPGTPSTRRGDMRSMDVSEDDQLEEELEGRKRRRRHRADVGAAEEERHRQKHRQQKRRREEEVIEVEDDQGDTQTSVMDDFRQNVPQNTRSAHLVAWDNVVVCEIKKLATVIGRNSTAGDRPVDLDLRPVSLRNQLSHKQARIVYNTDTNTFAIQAIGSKPIIINGQPHLAGEIPLTDGTDVVIGRFPMRFVIPPDFVRPI